MKQSIENLANLWIGMGCQKNTLASSLETVITEVFADYLLDLNCLKGIGTIDHKTQEFEILRLCQTKQWQLQFFTASQLAAVTVPHPTEVTNGFIGTSSVAEAAALLVAGIGSELLVPKQIYRLGGKAITIAVARAADRISWC